MPRDEGEPRDSSGELTYRIGTSERVSEAVLAAVDAVSGRSVVGTAGADGASTSRVLQPLYESIDPDALDALFRTTSSGIVRSEGTITFSYDGCEVTVDGDEVVRVRPVRENGADDDG